MITARSRSERRNYDCPKCGGHLWWDDEVTFVRAKKVPRHWWNAGDCRDSDDCPEGEHVHRRDRCGDCGWAQRRVTTDSTDTTAR